MRVTYAFDNAYASGPGTSSPIDKPQAAHDNARPLMRTTLANSIRKPSIASLAMGRFAVEPMGQRNVHAWEQERT